MTVSTSGKHLKSYNRSKKVLIFALLLKLQHSVSSKEPKRYAHINVLPNQYSSMQNSLFFSVCRGVIMLTQCNGHRAKMSMESGNRAVWIIKRDYCARRSECKSYNMLLLVGPSRCNTAMKAGYPSRGGAPKPCYGESKFQPTLPNINLCDGSIYTLYLSVYLGM